MPAVRSLREALLAHAPLPPRSDPELEGLVASTPAVSFARAGIRSSPDEVVRILVDQAIEDGDGKRLLAAMNQAYGTPAQSLDVEVEHKRPEQMTAQDVDAGLELELARILGGDAQR